MANLKNTITPRQLEILNLVKSGYRDKAIATELSLSVGTIKSHLQNIFKRLRATNRTDAVIKAFKLGYLNIYRR